MIIAKIKALEIINFLKENFYSNVDLEKGFKPNQFYIMNNLFKSLIGCIPFAIFQMIYIRRIDFKKNKYYYSFRCQLLTIHYIFKF